MIALRKPLARLMRAGETSEHYVNHIVGHRVRCGVAGLPFVRPAAISTDWLIAQEFAVDDANWTDSRDGEQWARFAERTRQIVPPLPVLVSRFRCSERRHALKNAKDGIRRAGLSFCFAIKWSSIVTSFAQEHRIDNVQKV